MKLSSRAKGKLPPPSEKVLQKAILDYLRRKGYIAFKFPSVGIWRKDTQRYIPQPRKGISDIVGCTKQGLFFAIEVKKEGNKATPEQLAFLDEVGKHHGIAFLAYSLQDVMDVL